VDFNTSFQLKPEARSLITQE